ncbi:acyl-CoA synthetase [Thermomonospora curvata]|uniref:AMP-dependent synthetase and ligase n=1 Tax=Thermomonospora curvata (strain ATCC 19995 / DSM 43183 / JCM 3096 / KCTC 9072 / NBRC 15933 / NCIMB 10081 / Henssen B9) TaxID=471852 RepID=D1AE83_THECD|nr:acyl-CoA synthetase [Thermomonospora curvata]ACY99509.1 AMP-dependent synthetase and ligase [Thermomonospora curvata DSM 43183]
MEFNYADLFEGVADAIGGRTAAVCGDQRVTYAELDAQATRLAHHLQEAGVEPGQHVAIQLYNGLEYITALLAALKIRAVPININYRYVESELVYLYTDSDSVALIYDVEFDERVAAAAAHAPKLRHFIAVGGESAVPGAVRFEDALRGRSTERDFPVRSGKDLYIIYTGGTTGMPKGVMWEMEQMLHAFWNPTMPRPAKPEDVIAQAAGSGPLVMMPVAPLMHGAAQMNTWIAWWMGATLVYVRKFDPAEVWRAVEREKVNSMTVTGDAMAIPLAEELTRNSYDLSSLYAFVSTGAILTGAVRQRLSALLPNLMIMDRFGSTESGSTAEATAGSSPEKGLKFAADTDSIAVLDESLRPVEPGSGVLGQVARTGHIPVGYYNDPEKTARTFPEIDGKRWLLTGDIATVEADGTIAVFGRGSQAINTGGEKVFPEEVEAVLKGHPAVYDAVVTGVPDERWGNRVAAVVQPSAGHTPTFEELDAHCRKHLSGYKVPRVYAFVPEMKRSPAGKADYRWAKEVARRAAAPA